MNLVPLLILLCISAFFSSSEAAYFSLKETDRNRLKTGGALARLAESLTHDWERLLSTILFGNLVVNLLFFTLSTIWVLQLQKDGQTTYAGIVAVVSFIAILTLGEMLPKDISILKPTFFAVLWSLPLSIIYKVLAPLVPVFNTVNLLSRRLLFPDFEKEPYLQGSDMERALELSKSDATLLRREQTVLQNILSLSSIRNEELMRPRTLLKIHAPPVYFSDLQEEYKDRMMDYIWISETDTDELASAVSINRIAGNAKTVWNANSAPVIYVPWKGTIAQSFEIMLESKIHAAAVLNEHGETIGALTYSDILDTLFTTSSCRNRRLLHRYSLSPAGEGKWLVTGITSLRRLEKRFRVKLPKHESTTVGGLLQENLLRLPEIGDTIDFAPFHFQVTEIMDDKTPIVELTKN